MMRYEKLIVTKRGLWTLAFKSLVYGLVTTSAYAQNLLENAGFEDVIAPIHGDNLDVDISPWIKGPEDSAPGKLFRKLSVVSTNPDSNHSPNWIATSWAENGKTGLNSLHPQIDATSRDGDVVGHYVRFYSTGSYLGRTSLFQWFVAPVGGCVQFGGAVRSIRRGNSEFFISLSDLDWDVMESLPATASMAAKIARSQIGMPIESTKDTIINTQNWTNITATKTLIAGQSYNFSVTIPPTTLFDNAVVEYIDAANCS